MKTCLVRLLFNVSCFALVIFGYRLLVDVLSHGSNNWWAFALVGTLLIIIGAFGIIVQLFGAKK